MAELLFRYLSDCRVDKRQMSYIHEVKAKDKHQRNTTMAEDFQSYNDISRATVNYITFLEKFDAFWLKKPPVIRSREKSIIEQKLDQLKEERVLAQNKTIFKLLDLDNDD